MKVAQPPSVTIRQIEFELEKAEHGMGMPYDAERVGQLRRCSSRRGSRNCPPGLRRDGSRGSDEAGGLENAPAGFLTIVTRGVTRAKNPSPASRH